MNATDYVINAVLVLLVLRQIRETRLTWQILLLPVLIVVGAACYYLRSVPTAGNDLLLDVTLAAAGAVLGGLCALFTHLRHGAAIERFSVAHSITSVDAWVAALFLMALAEVVTRLAVLWIRSRRLPTTDAGAPAAVPAVATV